MISVSFNENDEHGSDLLPWMAATIRAEHGRYNENKSTLSRSLGFEDGSIHGTISFAFKDLGALVDHQIGLTDNAPISEITIKHRRFGIDARKPIFSGKPDSAQIRSHPIPCRVRVRTFDDPDVWIPGSLFLPAVPGIRLELCKLRVVADFLDIVISGTGVASPNFSFDGAAQRTLSSLRNLIDVARYAERGLIQIQICSEKWPNLSLGGTLPLNWESDQLQQLSNAVSCLETIATDVLPTEFTISLVDVYAAWEAIGRLNGLATSSEMRGSFELDRPADLVASPEAAIYFYDYVDVGQWTLLTVVRRPILQICKNESRYEFCFGKPRVAEALVRHGKGTDSLAELQVLYRQAVAIEKSKVLEIHDGDFCALYATCQSNEDRRETG